MAGAPTIRRNLGAVALLLVLAAALAGCGEARGSERPAATVDGVDISQEQVQQLVEQQIAFQEMQVEALEARAKAAPDDPQAAANAESASQQVDELLIDFKGTGDTDTYGAVGAARVLSSLVDLELARQMLSDAGGTVEQASIDTLMDQYREQATAAGLKTIKPFEQVLLVQAEQEVIRTQLRTRLKSAVEAREAQVQQEFDEVYADGIACVRVIQSNDQASSQAALDRVAAGEDFATVAGEVSIVKDQPGALEEQCDVPRGGLVNVFGEEAVAAAQPGTVLGPANGSEEGQTPVWIAVRIESIESPTIDELRDQIESTLVQREQGDQAVQQNAADVAVAQAIQESMQKAEVVVNPRFGSWNDSTLQVDPPTDPAAAPTTTAPVVVATVPAGN